MMHKEYEEGHVLVPKMKNGSLLKIGNNSNLLLIKVEQHFNRFQKKMFKLCFGITVVDYTEE